MEGVSVDRVKGVSVDWVNYRLELVLTPKTTTCDGCNINTDAMALTICRHNNNDNKGWWREYQRGCQTKLAWTTKVGCTMTTRADGG